MTDWTQLFGDLTIAQGLTWIIGVGLLVVAIIKLWRPLSAFKDFMDDVKGEAARPGVPERPGLMVRISRMEERAEQTGAKVDTMSTSLAEVRHEVMPNTGASMNDTITRTENAVGALADSLADAHKKLDADNRRIRDLTETVVKYHPEEGTK
ncbi:MAG: hypothetical protein JSS52_11345 [Proteobacteria bacterium]|nr:hypothetical protein [Pseudomonadota bacterium]